MYECRILGQKLGYDKRVTIELLCSWQILKEVYVRLFPNPRCSTT